MPEEEERHRKLLTQGKVGGVPRKKGNKRMLGVQPQPASDRTMSREQQRQAGVCFLNSSFICLISPYPHPTPSGGCRASWHQLRLAVGSPSVLPSCCLGPAQARASPKTHPCA